MLTSTMCLFFLSKRWRIISITIIPNVMGRTLSFFRPPRTIPFIDANGTGTNLTATKDAYNLDTVDRWEPRNQYLQTLYTTVKSQLSVFGENPTLLVHAAVNSKRSRNAPTLGRVPLVSGSRATRGLDDKSFPLFSHPTLHVTSLCTTHDENLHPACYVLLTSRVFNPLFIDWHFSKPPTIRRQILTPLKDLDAIQTDYLFMSIAVVRK